MDKKSIDPNYRKMIPAFKKAKYCSFLVLPFQFEEDGLNKEWERQYMEPFTISSSDLNSIVESMMNEDGTISIGRCWRISKDVLIKKMSAGKVSADTHSFYVEKEQCNGWFDFEDSYLFEFHTNIAFLVLTITYKNLETIAYITDKGYSRERSQFYYIEGQDKHFLTIQNWISNLVVTIGLKSFF